MPDVRSLVGRLLQKKKKQQTPPTATTGNTAKPPVDEAAAKLATARQKVQASLGQLDTDIKALPFAPLITPLDKVATTLRAQMATLDNLPDVASQSSRLMQIGEAAVRLVGDVRKAETQGKQLTAADGTLDQSFTALAQQLKAITVATVRQPLADRLAALRQEQATAKSATDLPGLLALLAIEAKAKQLATDATEAQAALKTATEQVDLWSDVPQAALQKKLAKVSSSIRAKVKDDLAAAVGLGQQAKAKLAQGAFADVKTLATQAYFAFDAISKRVEPLQRLEALKSRRDEAVVVLGTLKSHPKFTEAFSAQASTLTGLIDDAKRVLAKGESASAKDISDAFEELAPAQRSATKSLAEYDS